MSKVIKNKQTSLLSSTDDPRALKYLDILLIVLNQPLNTSITLLEMRNDLRIIGLIQDHLKSDEITINDSDYKYLLDKVLQSKWNVKHKDLLTFADYIESL